MEPSCLVSGALAFIPYEHLLNATAYFSVAADHVGPYMATVYPLSNGYFPQVNVPCHKAHVISRFQGSTNMTVSSAYSNGLHRHRITLIDNFGTNGTKV